MTRLAWTIEAKDGKKLTKEQQKKVDKVKRILNHPNPDDNFTSFIGQMIEDMLVTGWGVAEIKHFPAGGDHEYLLYPVDGASVQIYLDWDGSPNKPRYAQTDYNGNEIPFLNSELMVMKHIPRTNTPFGLAPVEVAVNEIEYLLNAQAFAGRTASNTTPKKLLWLQGMSQDQINTLRAWWKSDVEGSASIPFLGGDGDAKSIELGLVTDQNLFLKWQEFLVAIIADAFDIDVQKVNLIVGINRSTGDNLDDVTDESAIRPLASTIEQYINQYLLGLYGLSDVAEFRFLFITSYTDRKRLSVVHQIYLQADSLTVNDVRAEIGKPPIGYTDPLTGMDIGDYTLTSYRAACQRIFGMPSMPGDGEGDGEREDADLDPSGGGNNGVHGAKTPKDKPLNKADERENG